MGMSASQARLLSLQARMSDVEYEGQQINQQRLVLSNKMNEVMEKMTNMDVPTPPSKQDFLYNKYSGKTKNGKKISAEMNDNGYFDVTKDVSGRIVEDAGLQNITSGSQMKGSEVSIPIKSSDAYHVCKGDEEANVHISDTPTGYPFGFTKYETKDFGRLYTEDSPKSINLVPPSVYKGASVNGYDNYCYADDPSNTYITIPKYTAQLNYKGGEYEGDPAQPNAKYYGTSGPKRVGTKYRLGNTDYDANNLPVKTKGYYDNNNKWVEPVYYKKSELTEVHSYQLYDRKTGKESGVTDYSASVPKTVPYKPDYNLSYTEERVSVADLASNGKLKYEDYQKALKDYIQEYSANAIMGGLTKVDGIQEAGGQFSINNANATGYRFFDVAKNSQYTYSKFVGVDSEPVSGDFDSSADYVRTNPNAAIGNGVGRLKSGSDLIQHNNDVDEAMSKTYYYETDDGKFKSCNANEARAKAQGGKAVFAEVDGGGKGITNREPDFKAVVKDNMYIMDDDNSALLIKENGGFDWAVAQITNGKKLFQKGTGDVVAYDKNQENSTTVNGCETMTVEEALGMDIYAKSTAFQDALSGLQHCFPAPGESGYIDGQPNDWRNFSVIIDNSGTSTSYRFCLTNDLKSVDNQVRVYTPGVGTYQDVIKNVEPTYDENGYLEKLILPNGEVVDMEVEQVVDEVEYDKAMNKYEIAKIEYDKEVNELNKQTSIYQRQDKQLELKLTRLDTERNALNTEIDAVKKVIQDATEKGFKTFSG